MFQIIGKMIDRKGNNKDLQIKGKRRFKTYEDAEHHLFSNVKCNNHRAIDYHTVF